MFVDHVVVVVSTSQVALGYDCLVMCPFAYLQTVQLEPSACQCIQISSGKQGRAKNCSFVRPEIHRLVLIACAYLAVAENDAPD